MENSQQKRAGCGWLGCKNALQPLSQTKGSAF